MSAAVLAPAGTDATAGARRIHAAFARARADGRAALIPYVVAGYPDAETSVTIALAAADAGADLLEVGLPYSDPLADGATIQRASGIALRNGATFAGSLRLVDRIAKARPDLPLIPMAKFAEISPSSTARKLRRIPRSTPIPGRRTSHQPTRTPRAS